MKKFIIIAALISSPAFAADTTMPIKDPYVNKHPHGEFGMRLFDKMDSNHDGAVFKEELAAHHRVKFNEIDSNHDGKLTAAEAKTAKRENSFNKLADKAKKDYLTFEDTFVTEEAYFTDADANHDGKVTKEEYKKHYLASFEKNKTANPKK